MDPALLAHAQAKVRDLTQRFDGFRAIILDDWRGVRLIYDTDPSPCCRLGCDRCPLARLLQDEPSGAFTARLLRASDEDRRLFGPQTFLNWRSIRQYRDCYVSFLLQRCRTAQEVEDELVLVQGMRVLYVKYGHPAAIERLFKRSVLSHAIARADATLRGLLQSNRMSGKIDCGE